MTKTNADCLRFLPDRRLGSFHRLRDLHHGCPCFRMGFELPQILFSPRIANGGLLFRHGFLHCSLGRIDVAIVAARVEPIRLRLSALYSCTIPSMDQGRIRKIIHIDMDAFYASVEQRDDPTLKGKPVAVGYPAKRGVVAAASYEARRFGVRSAMPSTIAMRKCSELVFVPPRFDVYRDVSNQIHAIFTDRHPIRWRQPSAKEATARLPPIAALTARPRRKLKRGRNHSPIVGPTVPTHPRGQVHSLPLYAHVLSATLFEDLALPLCANSSRCMSAWQAGLVAAFTAVPNSPS